MPRAAATADHATVAATVAVSDATAPRDEIDYLFGPLSAFAPEVEQALAAAQTRLQNVQNAARAQAGGVGGPVRTRVQSTVAGAGVPRRVCTAPRDRRSPSPPSWRTRRGPPAGGCLRRSRPCHRGRHGIEAAGRRHGHRRARTVGPVAAGTAAAVLPPVAGTVLGGVLPAAGHAVGHTTGLADGVVADVRPLAWHAVGVRPRSGTGPAPMCGRSCTA
ncbi:hypothetical protein E4K10_25405 [Streptomyces sp. T1317-0309]|nr:hypothetical protein E4K10_25405 [Streptomyces sp. T1317-0309]